MSEGSSREDHGDGVEEVKDEEDDGHVRVEADGLLGAEGQEGGGREGGGVRHA